MAEQSNCSGNCSSCSQNCSSKNDPKSLLEPTGEYNSIKHVIGVVSGKGGVGKSMVTSSLAVLMSKMGYKVGILDADITGPSIPKMFGINCRAMMDDKGIIPAETANGIKIMSCNLLLENPDAPVVWRGPVLAGAVKQFWTDVNWGEVDYMFVDMPPGTGDVPLTVFQSIPLDGIVVVASPQELVGMIVEKAVKMANMMDVPVLGIVENMSYFACPECGKRFSVFGESHVDEIAEKYGTRVLAKLPIDPELAKSVDDGRVEFFECNYLDEAAEKL